jgi:outer membrane protease
MLSIFSHSFALELSVDTYTGAMYGVSQELVWATVNGSQYLLSELDWSLQPLILWGIKVELKLPSGFDASIDLQSGAPMQTGYIEDSDWTALDAAHTKTNYSRHENHTESALIIDTLLSWELSPFESISFQFFGQFGYMHFEWTARNGYLEYPPGSPKIYIYGTSMAYEQDWLIPAAGLGSQIGIAGGLAVRLSFAFSPFVFCFDVDNHILRGMEYRENMNSGLFFEPKASLQWRFTDKIGFQTDIAWRYITGAIGDTVQMYNGVFGLPYTEGGHVWTYPGETRTYKKSGGAAFNAVKAYVYFIINL